MPHLQPLKDLVYSCPDGQPLHLDLYQPAAGPRPAPVVLWVTGGGWGHCDRTTVPLLLLEHGFVMASLTYRTTAQAAAPANVHDCKAAIRWLRANAALYGLDPQRIGAWGSSAGGHLVALLGTTSGLRELEGAGGNPDHSSAVQAVCDFCGPTDLTQMAVPEIRDRHLTLVAVVDAYLGGPIAQRLELARLVSPLTHVSAVSSPFLIVHGETDGTVPATESLALHQALRRAGADSALHILPQIGHGWEASLSDELVARFFTDKLAVATDLAAH